MDGQLVYRGGELARIASTSLSPQTIKLYRQLKSDYDIVHAHLPNPLANLAIRGAHKGIKIVSHWHSDIIKQRHLMKLYAPLQSWLLRRSDAVIATSQDYLEGSPWLRPHRGKVHVVPIGVDTEHLNVDEAAVAEIRRRYGGGKIIFSLGRLTYYKGFEFLIRAAHQVENARILIGGDGEERQALQQLIRDCGVQDRVDLIGRIPADQIGSYFRACDVFCLPSHLKSEAFGVVQLEAMASGRPVVSTAIEGSGVGWVNQDGVSGLVVPPASPDALARALNRLIEDGDLRQRLGEGARARYESRFRKKHMVRGVIDVYRSLMDDNQD